MTLKPQTPHLFKALATCFLMGQGAVAHAQVVVQPLIPLEPAIHREIVSFACKPSIHGVGVGACEGELAAWLLHLPRPARNVTAKCEVWVSFVQNGSRQVQRLVLEDRMAQGTPMAPFVTLPIRLNLSSPVRPVTDVYISKTFCTAAWQWAN